MKIKLRISIYLTAYIILFMSTVFLPVIPICVVSIIEEVSVTNIYQLIPIGIMYSVISTIIWMLIGKSLLSKVDTLTDIENSSEKIPLSEIERYQKKIEKMIEENDILEKAIKRHDKEEKDLECYEWYLERRYGFKLKNK